ncbi:glucosamine-6-phosphate deaminase NagB-II [Paraferrimonas haliotis]|uniref:Glutamine--fructose-6-phosphate aminotransferase n=1 Tax=Paraferrimonas haliotis TaxID=2013866 RepID=A0AA37TVZ5_9GAMM|nr:SIS domain-containing protein [Paraferrimonas haliotis]GLS84054.1 glutamine--fructose-6-phosphate aminotransferase [Paraferrimonas haliotis]
MSTIMRKEALSTPERLNIQLTENEPLMTELGDKIRQYNPHSVMIIGRGSSDHAGVFGKYLIEIEAGVPTFAAAPSVASVYGKTLKLAGTLVIVISQSGRSPDIIAQAAMAKEAGALCIALVNDEQAPIREVVDCFVPLHAGEEKAVAATKSYLATLSALAQLVGCWTNNSELLDGLKQLPAALQTAIDGPAQLKAQALENVGNLVVLGRGLGYGITKEIALKLKEVCGIHAESFSSAEFLHGPVTLLEQGLLLLDVSVRDESLASHQSQIEEMRSRGGQLVHMHQGEALVHPRLAPLLVLQRFYLDVEQVALARGLNPDAPKGLNKVTRTL